MRSQVGGRVNGFDRRFGPAFLQQVPQAPGVYEMLDAGGATVYVGKAKHLRRRLAQYRRATRKKAHAKMRRILRRAAAVRLHPCATELAALLLEQQLIGALRPPLNLAGAYSFLYPCVGVRLHERDVDLCCTTSPAELPAFQFYGAFRDRTLVREAFAALGRLLAFVAHPEPASRLTDLPRVRFTRVIRFRQLDRRWTDLLVDFLRGDSNALLPELVLALLERPAARRRRQEIQAWLDALDRFYARECLALRVALRALDRGREAGVDQAARDPLFLEARARLRDGAKDAKDTSVRNCFVPFVSFVLCFSPRRVVAGRSAGRGAAPSIPPDRSSSPPRR